MRTFQLLASITALTLGGLARAEAADPRPAQSVALRAEPGKLAGIALVRSRAGEETVRQQVTDMLLRLRQAQMPLTTALLLGNENRVERGRARIVFGIEITVVAGGRLYVEDAARCTGWVRDAATCRIGCDGGTFLLTRMQAEGHLKLALVLGETSPGHGRDGLRLGACADSGEAEDEIALAPAGDRQLAEVDLVRR